ncbi:MAG: LacI family DNA-binding transcriptional regulator [Armatimonadota bacterium]
MKPPLPSAVAAPPRRTTLTDVAAAAGVSRTAVSYVLSGRTVGIRVPETTRQRILEAAEQVGYRRNALGLALRSGRMDTVGIIAPVSIMIGEPGKPGGVYYKDLTAALAAAAFEAGLNPLLMSETPHHSISLADLSDRRVDGVILVAKTSNESLVRDAAAEGVPCVTISRDIGTWQVATDNRWGARLAAEHLLGLGHRRFAFLTYEEDSYSSHHRGEGFRTALRDAGSPPDSLTTHLYDQPNRLRVALRSQTRPTAIFCFNDEIAVWLLDICREEGIHVPEDMSVVGFDNNILAVTVRPRLTTVQSPLVELARAALSLFQQQLRGEPPPPTPVLIKPQLVVRDSTASRTLSQ